MLEPVWLHVGRCELCVSCQRQIADRTVWANGVVVSLLVRKQAVCMIKRREQRLVQKFVTQTAVEALNESILLRLSGSY